MGKVLDGRKAELSEQVPPSAHLDVEYVYGFRCFDTRNNLKVLNDGRILYSSASLAIIENVETHNQEFYTRHTNDVTCLQLSNDAQLVATGQVGASPQLCIWKVADLQTVCIIEGLFKNVVQDVVFANDK